MSSFAFSLFIRSTAFSAFLLLASNSAILVATLTFSRSSCSEAILITLMTRERDIHNIIAIAHIAYEVSNAAIQAYLATGNLYTVDLKGVKVDSYATKGPHALLQIDSG